MRRAPVVATLALAAFSGATAETLPEAWSHWEYLRHVDLPPAGDARLARVVLPIEVVGRARPGLEDLRVIDDRGDEVPYVLHVRHGRRTGDWREARRIDSGFVEGSHTRLLADTGTEGRLHNALELDVSETDFFAWVEVAASDDRDTWRIVRERAPIYRFEKDDIEGSCLIRYPETGSRWLRVRLLEPGRPIEVRRCRVAHEVVEEAEREPVPGVPAAVPDPPRKESRWEIDLDWPNVPVSGVRFEAAQEEFHRPVRVSESVDGETWTLAARGEIYRYATAGREGAEGTRVHSQLSVDFHEVRGRYWRVSILDRDDTPVGGLRAELAWTPRHVVFRPQPGRSYRLVYGNSRAKVPAYDLVRVTTRTDIEGAPAGALRAAARNEGYVSPEPWTERNPWLLWVALGVAVVVLAWLALRALR